MKRGEIWIGADTEPYARKPRPLIIVQHDSFDTTGSVTVCGLTSYSTDSPLIRPAVEPTESNGLKLSSWIMVDKMTTVPRKRLSHLIGVLTSVELAAMNRSILTFLGPALPNE
jgi:mRNA interferase MazF